VTDGSHTLMGIAGSHGVVIAPAIVIGNHKVSFWRRRVRHEQKDAEWKRFVSAVTGVQDDLRRKIEALETGGVEASILEAYLLMVGDETLADQVRLRMYDKSYGADWAVAAATEQLATRLGAVDDPYMRERSHDVGFVGDLLLRALGGTSQVTTLSVDEPTIVVARDLSPADTAGMVGQRVVGFVTEVGSRTSHTSIMARALEIPAVVGVKDAVLQVESGDIVIVDGLRGRVVVNPEPEEVEDAERRALRYAAMAQQLGAHRDEPALTTDGTRVGLGANIELPDEAAIALEHGAESVGLYRTEFLYVNRASPPTEDEQYEIFMRVLDTMGDRTITLRTFDIGGDKFVTAFRLPDELNPMLGLRAVRLALQEREVFLAHLRAMVRASAHGNVRIMIPLVSSIGELRAVRELLEQARAEVIDHGGAAADSIELGVMIEVPAAAMMADVFAAEADFMSIGTNDLVQYALAIDRTNRALAYLASPYDPSILRMIERVIAAGAAHGCPVSVCGEMASEPYGALLLLGLGIRSLSMESVAIPEIKEAVNRSSLAELRELAIQALAMSTAVEVEQLLEQALEPRLHDLLTGQPDSIPTSHRTPSFGIPRVLPGDGTDAD